MEFISSRSHANCHFPTQNLTIPPPPPTISYTSLFQTRVQVELLLAPPDQEPQFRVHKAAAAQVDILRVVALGEPPVVLHQQVCQRILDLVGREEPAGARVRAVPEAQVQGAGADEVGDVLPLRVVVLA